MGGHSIFGRSALLGGASVLAMLAGLAAPAPASAQSTPGSPECPIVNRIVTCTGNLPEGVDVPAGADRDGLTVENLTADITLNFTTATARPAIDYTAGTPISTIRIVDPDNMISLTTAASATASAQNRIDILTSAILLTATDNSVFSLLADIDIDARATCAFTDCIRRRDIVPNGITVRGSLGDFAIDNRGDISLDIEEDARANPHAISVDVFNADLVTIRNSGNLSAVNAGGIQAAIYARRVEITNDGSIILQDNRDTAVGGISLLDFDQPYADGYVRPAMPESIDFTYRIVNNGLIRVAGSFNEAGIRHNSSYLIADGFVRNAIGTGEIVNNGTIEAGLGILLFHIGEVTITNNGRIEADTGMFVVQGDGTARIFNTASGMIVSNQGVVIDGGTADVTNAGSIEASGDAASGLAARGIYVRTAITTLDSATIDNSGQVAVTGNGARAVEVSNNDGPTLFTNSGTITADGDNAIALSFEHPSFDDDMPEDLIGTTEVDLTATSIVRGGSGTDGAGITLFGGESNVVRNAGLIAADSGRAIVGGAGAETIDNSGRIEGSVTLGAGDDRIIGRDGGVITGAVDGGAGDDVLQIDVASGTAAYADRFGGAVTGFELLERTGAGTLTLASPVVPRTSLLGGTLVTSADLAAMAVDASGGTMLEATGRLGAVALAGGATLSPGGGGIGTVELASLTMADASRLRFDLGAPGQVGGADNDLIAVTGNLTLDGLLDVNARPNFGDGIYRLITYGGTFTDNGLAMGSAPATTYQVQTSVAGQINLVVGGVTLQFWDGGDTAADGVIDGGNGTWNNTTTNWTRTNGDVNEAWGGNFAVFQGTPGTVTVDSAGVAATGLQFAIDGYNVTGGPITLSAPATLRVGNGSAAGAAFTATITSAIAGADGLAKTDLGTLILTGANSYAGGATVSGGVLQVNGDGALGAASGALTLDGGTLRSGGSFASARLVTIGAAGGTIDTQANTLTLSGALGGAVALTKTGTGTLILSGASGGYAGTTTVNAGTLTLNGTLGGPLVIAAGATLNGTGSAASLDLSGTIAPGSSPGTLTIAGDATFRAGSTYRAELAANGASDRLEIGGQALIEGGTVAIVALDPELSYTDGAVVRILNAAGGRTGTFTTLTESSAFLDFALGYDATGVTVTIDVVRMFPDVAATFNQGQASTALMGFGPASTGDTLAVYNQLLLLDEGPARAAFDLASGEIYPVLVASELRRGAGLAERFLARGHARSGGGWGLWGGAAGHDARTDGDGNGARYAHDGLSAELGVDHAGPGNGWAVGFGFGYDAGDVDLADRASRGRRDGWHVGGYARYGSGGAGPTVSLFGAYASGEVDVTRNVAFGTLNRTATARVDLDAWALGAEARYGFAVGGDWALGPAVRLTHAEAEIGAFQETGANSLNLTGAAGNGDGRTRYGGGLFARWEGTGGSLDASLVWTTGGGEATELGLAIAGAPGATYRVRSAEGDGGAAQLDIAGAIELGGGWSLGANLGGTLGTRERYLQGNATIGWRF